MVKASEPVREILKALGASDDEIDDAADTGTGALVTLGASQLLKAKREEEEELEEPKPKRYEPEPEPPQLDERTAQILDTLVRNLGAKDDEIARAKAEGGNALFALAVDRLFIPGTERLTRLQVAERTGIPVEQAATYWRALGFADVSDDDPIFTEADVEILQLLKNLMSLGIIDRDVTLQMTRSIGRAMQSVAAAQVDTVRRVTSGLPVEQAQQQAIMALVQSREAFLDILERALVYVWRRHLAAEAKRTALTLTESSGGHVVVGFADLVGFTAMSAQMDEQTLATAVSRFESTAVEIVGGYNGRVIKMIGDEVMFDAPTPADGVAIALDLIDAFEQDETLPDVRAGVAEGMATPYQGDLYGPAPNLASRLVDEALPRSVLVSESVNDAVEQDARFELKALRPHNLKGFGRTRMWVARRR